MKNLSGKTIIIGKEPATSRLLVAIPVLNSQRAIGAPDSVPPCVSRCLPEQQRAHAKITIDSDGSLTIYNLNPNNSTFADGKEISIKRIEPSDLIELGKDRYRVRLPDILQAAEDMVSGKQEEIQKGEPVYDISHLEEVWNALQEKKRCLQKKQKRVNMIRSGCGIFTMCAMPCIFLFGPAGYLLTGIGIVGNLYSFIGLKNDNTPEVLERMQEEFQDAYVCPNPRCNKFLGNISYRLLKKQYSMKCPYCKSRYKEN